MQVPASVSQQQTQRPKAEECADGRDDCGPNPQEGLKPAKDEERREDQGDHRQEGELNRHSRWENTLQRNTPHTYPERDEPGGETARQNAHRPHL